MDSVQDLTTVDLRVAGGPESQRTPTTAAILRHQLRQYYHQELLICLSQSISAIFPLVLGRENVDYPKTLARSSDKYGSRTLYECLDLVGVDAQFLYSAADHASTVVYRTLHTHL